MMIHSSRATPRIFARNVSRPRSISISYVIQKIYPQQHQHQQQRLHVRYQHTVVYAVGEGWTGALGTGRIDQMILGHGDADHMNPQLQKQPQQSNGKKESWWSTFSTKPSGTPIVVYDTSSSSEGNNDTSTSKRLVSCAAGWGHTALIIEESITTNNSNTKFNTTDHVSIIDKSLPDDGVMLLPSQIPTTKINTQLLLTGRPHEFTSLLRLQRLPRTIRNWMTYHTYNTIRRANIIERDEDDSANEPGHNNTASHTTKFATSYNPIDIIGQTLTYLTKLFGNPKKDPDWVAARDQSYMIIPTTIPLPFDTTSTTTIATDTDMLSISDTTVPSTIDATSRPTTTAIATTASIATTTDLLTQIDVSLPATIDPRTAVLNDVPIDVACTAGVTAITTAQGYVYTFGLNGIGQCGIGDPCNNVWTPTRVTGLSRQFSAAGYRATALSQSFPIHQTCLGLQHGLCLNVAGEMFAWGKGDRGQLGNDSVENESHTAVPITKAVIMNDDYTSKVEYHALQYISQIATGMIHSAALEPDTNSVYIWGKHTLPYKTDETIATGPRSNSQTIFKRLMARDNVASDARIPVRVNGLPSDQSVMSIACGSHHTSILLEDGSVWCIGVTTDTKRPQHFPVCIVEAGMIELSTLTQFTAHMDRTTIVFDGQVLQVHLWEDPECQKNAIFVPTWVDELQTNYPMARIREVHRSWLHTAIVTDHEDYSKISE